MVDGEVRPSGRHSAALQIAIVFILAFAVRLPLMNAGLFHHDEVQLARAVEGSFETSRLQPAVKGRYGAVLLDLALYAPWHAITGASAEHVVPFAGILGGALLVASLLLLAREMTGDDLAGWVAAAFGASSTVFLTSSSTGKENTPQLAFFVFAAWLVSRGARTRSVPLRLAGTVIFAFALTIHEGGAVLVPPFAMSLAVLGAIYRLGWRAIAVDVLTLGASTVVPLKISIWDEIQRNLLVGSNSATFGGLLSPTLPSALRDSVPALGGAALAFSAIGLFLAVRARSPVVAIAPWLLPFVYFANVSSYSARYLLYVLPPVAVLASLGATHLVRRYARGRDRWVAAVVVLVACAPGVARAYPLLSARASASGPKAMALLLKEVSEPDAVVACFTDDAVFIEYYAKRAVVANSVDDPAAFATYVRELTGWARRGVRVYMLESSALGYRYEPQYRYAVGSAFRLVPVAAGTNEWYYRPELKDVSFPDFVYRLELR